MTVSVFTNDSPIRAPHGTIGNCIRALREKRGLTTRQLAKKLGVSQASISHWETGRMCPSRPHATALADTFNVPIEFLLAHRRKLFA